MPIRRILLALALLTLSCRQASAQPLVICLDTANPPFMYAASDGRASGVYPALLAEAFSRMDVPATLEAMPWKRALAMATAGASAIGGIYKNSNRLLVFDYSDVLYVERIQVVTMAARNIVFNGLDSLKGLRVGVLRGWSYGDAFDKARREGRFSTEEVDGDGQNISKLSAGRLDAIIIVKESADIHVAASGKREEFTIQPVPLAENEAYLAIAKTAGQKELLARFNMTLADMRSDGTFEKMVFSLISRK